MGHVVESPPSQTMLHAIRCAVEVESRQLVCGEGLAWAAPPLRGRPRPISRHPSGRHQHTHHEVCLAVEGEAIMQVGEKQFAFAAPSVATVEAGSWHAHAPRGETDHTALWIAIWSGTAFAHFSRYQKKTGWQPHGHFIAQCRDATRLAGLLVERSRSPEWFEALRACLLGILSEMYFQEHSVRSSAGAADRSVERLERTLTSLRKFLQSSLEKDLSIQQIAQMTMLSPNYLNHVFRQWSGESLHQYRMRLRMERAMELCRTSEMLIKQIAAAVGYKDALYFSRAFYRYHGVWPTQVRSAGEDSTPPPAHQE
jgi:AraC-like DNA-binding protein